MTDQNGNNPYASAEHEIDLADDARNLDPNTRWTVARVVARFGGDPHPNTIRNWGREFSEFLSEYGVGGRGRTRLYTRDDIIILNTIRALTAEGYTDYHYIRRQLNAHYRVYTLPHLPSEYEQQILEEERPVARAKYLALFSEASAMHLHIDRLESDLDRVTGELIRRTDEFSQLNADYRVARDEIDGKAEEIANLRVERERLSAQIEAEKLNAQTERSRAMGLGLAALIVIVGTCLIIVALVALGPTMF